VNIRVQGSAADSDAIRSARVPKLNEAASFVAFWHSAEFGPQSGALQAPADHSGFQFAAGLMIAPGAINEAAGERQLVRAATVLAKHLDQQFRWRLSLAIELGQPLFASCHFRSSPR
jgi:hypothetical protein